jgi:hypothetical protein
MMSTRLRACTRGNALSKLSSRCAVRGGATSRRSSQACASCVASRRSLSSRTQLLSAARLIHHDSVADTNILIDYICEEAERLKPRRARGQNRRGVKKDGEDEALANPGSEGGKKQRRKGKCHNCGKPGHWAKECRSPKREDNEIASAAQATSGSTKARPKNRPMGSPNVVIDKDLEGDSVRMAEEVEDHAQIVGADPVPFLLHLERLHRLGGRERGWRLAGQGEERGEMAATTITSVEDNTVMAFESNCMTLRVGVGV